MSTAEKVFVVAAFFAAALLWVCVPSRTERRDKRVKLARYRHPGGDR